MSQLSTFLEKNTLNQVKKQVSKTSIGRELINNLLYRLERRGNLMVEMDNHYVKAVRLDLSSDARHWIKESNKTKNFSIWVKPFIKISKTGFHYLMFNYNGVILRASDIFGDGINRVKLN